MPEEQNITIKEIPIDVTPAMELPADVPARGPIVFFCKNCKKMIDAERVGKKYQYKCLDCKKKDVAIGTEQSIRNFYRIK